MEQIIKFGISNYLQLCVEAGFSQIQSQLCICIKQITVHNYKVYSTTLYFCSYSAFAVVISLKNMLHEIFLYHC